MHRINDTPWVCQVTFILIFQVYTTYFNAFLNHFPGVLTTAVLAPAPTRFLRQCVVDRSSDFHEVLSRRVNKQISNSTDPLRHTLVLVSLSSCVIKGG